MEIVFRVVIVWLFVLFGLRVVGRRELSEMSPIDMVTLLLIAEIAAQALPGGEDFSLVNGLTGIATLLLLVFVSSQLHYLVPRVERAVEGRPTVLVQDGRFIYPNLDKERVTPAEVLKEVRHAGFAEIESVRWAILETDGRISVISGAGQET